MSTWLTAGEGRAATTGTAIPSRQASPGVTHSPGHMWQFRLTLKILMRREAEVRTACAIIVEERLRVKDLTQQVLDLEAQLLAACSIIREARSQTDTLQVQYASVRGEMWVCIVCLVGGHSIQIVLVW